MTGGRGRHCGCVRVQISVTLTRTISGGAFEALAVHYESPWCCRHAGMVGLDVAREYLREANGRQSCHIASPSPPYGAVSWRSWKYMRGRESA